MVGGAPTDPSRSRKSIGHLSAERVTFRRRDDDLSTELDITVSAEDDVEVRRVTVRNHGLRIREVELTSYAELVLTSAVSDLAHPAFGKLFVETEYLPGSAALLCHRRPRDADEAGLWAFHALSLDGRPQGPVEWETDRARFRPGRDAGERGGARWPPRTLRHHRGRARSDREPSSTGSAVAGRERPALFRDGNGRGSRDGALAQKYHQPGAPRAHSPSR